MRLPESPRPPRLSRAGIIAGLYGGLALLAVGVGLLRGNPDVWRGPGATPLKMVLSPLVGLGFGLVVVFLSRWATHRLQWARVLHDEFQAVLGELSPREIFLLAAFSSVGEEMFFRGALLPIVGLGWSSLVFAMLHVRRGARFLPWTLMAFIIGLMFGQMFVWMGDLGGPVVAHFTINYLNLKYIAGRR